MAKPSLPIDKEIYDLISLWVEHKINKEYQKSYAIKDLLWKRYKVSVKTTSLGVRWKRYTMEVDEKYPLYISE